MFGLLQVRKAVDRDNNIDIEIDVCFAFGKAV